MISLYNVVKSNEIIYEFFYDFDILYVYYSSGLLYILNDIKRVINIMNAIIELEGRGYEVENLEKINIFLYGYEFKDVIKNLNNKMVYISLNVNHFNGIMYMI